VTLRSANGDQALTCVYVPTNHLYLGDIFLMSRADVIIPDLSVREAIGMRSGNVLPTFSFEKK
jgi:hypothetical protein